MERGYFFDSTDTEQKIYQAADFARFHEQIIGNGVSNTVNLPDLTVSEKLNMTVLLGAGYAFADGYMYENTAALNLTHDVAEPTVDRIDRIIVRFDNTPGQRRTYALVRKGTADSLVPPAIVRDSYIFELSVAQVKIIAGKSFIEQTEITDERTDEEVCGYIPLHNIYRGLEIDSNGIVSLLNQPFIKTKNTAATQVYSATDRTNYLEYGTIIEDAQGEIISPTTFKAKARGVYSLWAEVGFKANPFPVGLDIQIYVYKNGQQSFPMIAKVLNSSNDNYVIASGIDRIEKGDEVKLLCQMFNLQGVTVTPDFMRQRIAKIS